MEQQHTTQSGLGVMDFLKQWKSEMSVMSSEYRTDINLVNTSVRLPMYKCSANTRKRRKILSQRIASTKKNPRTSSFKGCYQVNSDEDIPVHHAELIRHFTFGAG